MSKNKTSLSKVELHRIFNLWNRQPWVLEKDDHLHELLNSCNSDQEKFLIIDLLKEFHYLSIPVLNAYLQSIADFIVNDSGFQEDKIQIASLTIDDDADSSQKYLDYLKMKLHEKGWTKYKMSNRFGASIKNYNKGFKQVVYIDEFIGSGKTIAKRISTLKHELGDKLNVKFCFIAGMKHALEKEEFSEYEFFCPLKLDRGISDKYPPTEIEHVKKMMQGIEANLAENINDYKLQSFTFGYNYAEALYTSQGIGGNTPNSVFPIFWWPRDRGGQTRKTMLTRYEKGLI